MKHTPTEHEERAAAAREALAVRTLRRKVKEANELLRLGMTRSAEQLHDLFKDLAACAACWIDGDEAEQSLALSAMRGAERVADVAGFEARAARRSGGAAPLNRRGSAGPEARGAVHEAPRLVLHPAMDEADDAGRTAPPVAARTRLTCAVLTKGGGEPRSEFLLIPFGEVQVERPLVGDGSFEFTRRHAESALRWYESLGRKLAIDYEHQMFADVSPRADGLKPAAGWIGGLEIRADGLWAVDVVWTDRAAQLIRGGEYRYFSPVIFWTDEDRTDVAGLGPVALTNDPAMHGVAALAAGRERARQGGSRSETAGSGLASKTPTGAEAQTGGVMEEGELTYPRLIPVAECESAEDAGESDTERAVRFPVDARDDRRRSVARKRAGRVGRETVAARDAWEDGELVPARLVEDLRTEVSMLARRVAAQQADAFVERGMLEGKILDASSLDWRDDYLRDPAAAEDRLSRAPVLLPPGRVIRLDGRGEPAGAIGSAAVRGPTASTPRERAMAALRGDVARVGIGVDHGRTAARGEVEVEDLEAYERARAAGRVV